MRCNFYQLTSLQETLGLLAEYGSRAKLIAGGTDILVGIKEETTEVPECLISIGHISDLDGLKYQEGTGLTIGALTKVGELETSAQVREVYPALACAAKTIGSRQVRNLATAVGNVCNASPAADLVPVLLVLEASVKAVGQQGERTIKLEEFFLGPSQTALSPEELVTEISVPPPPNGARTAYMKHSVRRAMDIALVGVAVLARLDSKKQAVEDYRLALGAVAPTPIRARAVEEIILGKPPEENIILKVAQAASELAQPISDIRSSAEYRKEIVKVLVKRASKQALEEV